MPPRTRPRPPGEQPPHLADLAAQASKEAGGAPAELLDGYLPALARVSAGGRLSRAELRRRHDIGTLAAEQGVPLRAVIDLYLSATRLSWPTLPGVRAATGADPVRRTGEAVLRATDAAVQALAEGYEEAQRWSLRQEESFRREFVDDLLDGRNLESLAERAERYGLRLLSSHVLVAVCGTEPFADGGPVTRQVESAMRRHALAKDVLVTTKDGLLVCMAPDAPHLVQQVIDQVTEVLHGVGAWQAGVGRPQRGPGGAARSLEQARNALDIAGRLHLPGQVHLASDLLVYQVLMRDSAALTDLVDEVLEPLRKARTGPDVLLDTLSTYFAAGGVTTATAQRLHVGARTVTYRLGRVKALTGYSVHDPQQAFTLRVAVLGARLLDWPQRPDRPDRPGATMPGR